MTSKHKSSTVPVCPHCNREIANYAVAAHVGAYPYTPENHAKLTEYLPDHDKPGVMLSRERYTNLGVLPSSATLYKFFGSWPALGEAFGLLPPDPAGERLAAQDVRWEATSREIKRIAEALYQGDYGPHRREYERLCVQGVRKQEAPFGVDNLQHKYGEWANVLAQFGFSLPPNGMGIDDKPVRFGQAYWFDWRMDSDGYITVVTVNQPSQSYFMERV